MLLQMGVEVILHDDTREYSMDTAKQLKNELMTTAQTEWEAALVTAHAVVARIIPNCRPRITRLAGGIMNFMFLAQDRKHGKFVVRVYPPRRTKNGNFEPDVLRRLHSAGCAVPEVVGFLEKTAERPRACLVYKYIEGVSLEERLSTMSSREFTYLAKEIVEQLLLIKDVRVSGFGNLINGNAAAETRASEFIDGSIKSCIESCAKTHALDDVALSRLAALAGAGAYIWQKFDGALGWGDLSASNIIVNDSNRLAGLVDFEGTFALHCALSVGYLYAMQPEDPLYAAVLDEFRRASAELDDDTVDFCAVLRAIRMARYAGQELPTGVQQGKIFEVLPGAAIALAGLAGKLKL
jgi:aminoglycoside phosphotransferase (APT) family kinase protein